MTTRAGSGHVSSCFSAAEIVTVLYFGGVLRHRSADPLWPDRDRFVLSKGHAAPLLYAALAHAGFVEIDELRHLRMPGSRLQGHPVLQLVPGVEATSGSLGQGLSVGLGHALAGRLRGSNYHTYVLLGDGECQEGQVWEAAMAASHYGATRLTAIIDHNRFQETGPTERELTLAPFAAKWESFGWHVAAVDGHDLAALLDGLEAVRSPDRGPCAIIAHTVKGKGVSFVEADYTFHGRALTKAQVDRAKQELGCSQGR